MLLALASTADAGACCSPAAGSFSSTADASGRRAAAFFASEAAKATRGHRHPGGLISPPRGTVDRSVVGPPGAAWLAKSDDRVGIWEAFRGWPLKGESGQIVTLLLTTAKSVLYSHATSTLRD